MPCAAHQSSASACGSASARRRHYSRRQVSARDPQPLEASPRSRLPPAAPACTSCQWRAAACTSCTSWHLVVPRTGCRELSDASGAERGSSMVCCGHESCTAITAAAFQPDGRLLASGGMHAHLVGTCVHTCMHEMLACAPGIVPTGRGGIGTACGGGLPGGTQAPGPRGTLERPAAGSLAVRAPLAADLRARRRPSHHRALFFPSCSLPQATASSGGKVALFDCEQFRRGGVLGPVGVSCLEQAGGERRARGWGREGGRHHQASGAAIRLARSLRRRRGGLPGVCFLGEASLAWERPCLPGGADGGCRPCATHYSPARHAPCRPGSAPRVRRPCRCGDRAAVAAGQPPSCGQRQREHRVAAAAAASAALSCPGGRGPVGPCSPGRQPGAAGCGRQPTSRRQRRMLRWRR